MNGTNNMAEVKGFFINSLSLNRYDESKLLDVHTYDWHLCKPVLNVISSYYGFCSAFTDPYHS